MVFKLTVLRLCLDEHHSRLEHDHSNASSSSPRMTSEDPKELSAPYDYVRRRLEPINHSSSAADTPPSNPSSALTLQQPHLATLNPSARESSGSTPPLAPIARKGSSPGTDESSSDQQQQDRSIFHRRTQHNIPRLLPSESSSTTSGSVMLMPHVSDSLRSRRSPTRNADQIPRITHQSSSYASDSSKSSVVSSQSSGMTAATSLSIHKSSEDDGKQAVVLPPISSFTGLSRDVPPMDHHSGRMISHGISTPGTVAYGSYRAPQPPLAPLSGTPSQVF